MKKSTFLLVAALLAGFNAGAATYFATPAGAGEQDGSSWENAFPAESLADILEGVESGDIIYFGAGTYNGVTVNMVDGISVIGGFPASATGTDVSGYNPSVNKTIFDAQGKNGGEPFISVNNEEQSKQATEIKGVTFTGATGGNITEYKGTVLYTRKAIMKIEDVTFENNVTSWGGIVVPYKSQFYAKHCVWRNNVNNYYEVHYDAAGSGDKKKNNTGAVCISARGGETEHSLVVLEGCTMTGNTLANAELAKTVFCYGGLIANQDKSVDLVMVNNLLDGSGLTLKQNGGCLRQANKCQMIMAYNTLYNFNTTDPNDSKGVVCSINAETPFFIAGNIIVSPMTTDVPKVYAFFDQNNNKLKYLTGGYNSIGGRYMNSQPESIWETGLVNNTWASTDNWNVATQSDVLGSNKITEKDGGYYIEPLASCGDVNVASVQAAFDACDFLTAFKDVKIDLSVDIYGNKRAATSYRGCYDPNASAGGSGIADVAVSGDDIKVVSLGNGSFKVEGTEGVADVYDISGRKVLTQELGDNSIISLEGMAGGVYIIKAGNASVKVAK